MIDEKKLIAAIEAYAKDKTDIGHWYDRLWGMRMAIEIINQQPKVGEWIPFIVDDEGMLDCEIPDEGEEILVSDGVNVVTDIFMNDGEECYLDGWSRDLVGLAWKPLPEPWEGE